jgi:hypothetical protein
MLRVFAMRFLLTVGALAAIAGSAAAQTLADKTKQAEAFADSGKFVDALAALDEAETLVWERMPLACRRILWVADKAAGFGIYNPRESDVYGAGADMLAYAEPIGFGWRKSGDIWHADLAADVVIRSENGTELFSKPDFGHFPIASRVRNREFQLDLKFTLSGVPAGKYVLETTLRDTIGGKKGTCRLPFTIR